MIQDECPASAPCSEQCLLRAGVVEVVARRGVEVGAPGVVALPVAVTWKVRAWGI